jgi:hypothetical protein
MNEAKNNNKTAFATGNLPRNATTSPTVTKEETNQPSLFASNQFWQMAPTPTAAKPKPNLNKSTVDFATFDFWSQPSSANNSP